MKPRILIVLASIILLAWSAPMVQADNPKDSGCITHIDLKPESEYQEGGSKYKVAALTAKEKKEHNSDHDKVAATMHNDTGAEDKDDHKEAKVEAHGDHRGKMGGIFFMAPNKIHHLEGFYNEKCGFSLAVYNAFTEPIRINRFQAFVKYIPEDEDQLETIRFLSPTKDGSLLQGPSPVGIDGPYEVVLYVKFPLNDEPAMFNIPVAEEMAAKGGHDDGDDH